MKHIFFGIIAALVLSSCIKNDPITNAKNFIEFDAATYNANASGTTYPIMTVVPTQGAAGGSPAITRTIGSFVTRVNLLGAQRKMPTTFNYQVVSGESTAQQGVHYGALSGTGTIPKDSSFALITIPVLNPGPSTLTSVDLVLELLPGADLPVNVNYSKIGFRIAQ